MKTILKFLTENELIYKPLNKNIKLKVFTEDEENGLGVRIDSIIVPKKFRYSGIGRTEVENIIRWAKEIDANYLIIESDRPAIEFWKKMGFDIHDQGSELSTGIIWLNKPNHNEED